ncbi:MAG: hypothetical protein Hyperionvirus5_114 [Hyperionvirus sp.]|uniref:Uncharacterized protein n=1 Tax=Hyperionvirus sp. TaxID=2487770 RepID=A0A3G5A803_9VIRU|nr:MAG: hypothetical protein Hyperionvirus5_114 [Hyperionvirus sp.]
MVKRKLYEDDCCIQYFSPNDEYSSWEEFMKEKPYNGNATFPLKIIDFSWYNPAYTFTEKELARLNEEDKKHQLFLICKYWSLISNSYPIFIFKINVEKKNEPAVRKFIKEHKHKIEI